MTQVQYIAPPAGWYDFGTHAGIEVADGSTRRKFEFSEETDEGGLPRWERPIPSELNECLVCGTTDPQKPMCFRKTDWCCDDHRKLIQHG